MGPPRGSRLMPVAPRLRPLVLLLLLAGATPVLGQRVQPFAAGMPALNTHSPFSPTPTPVPERRRAGPSPAGAFLASALIPGAGQYRLAADRWVAYLGVEAWAWLTYADAVGEAASLRDDYRDLAWSVARRIGVGEREEREFEYYEAMSNYPGSGSFDADPLAGGIQPEEDEDTFNGTVWALARAIFHPAGSDSVAPTEDAQAAALAYYEEHAIRPPFAWSWGTNLLEKEHFGSLIRRSDEAARAATTLLGVILVNHVVSAVDAMLTARLRRGGDGVPVRLRSETFRGPLGPGNYIILEVGLP